MSKSRSELRWHLSRGDEPSCLLTQLELQHLIDLDQLKDSDLLWKPGLTGWQRADALPGVLMSPALPSKGVEPIAEVSHAADRRSVADALKIARKWTKRLPIVFRIKSTRFTGICSMQFEILDAHARKAADRLHETIRSTKALRWIDQPGGVAILLGLTLIFGFLNLAMQGFAVEAEEVSPITRSAEPMQCPQLKRGSEISASSTDIFAGFALLTDPGVISEPDSNSIDPVPLPLKKPAQATSDKSAHRVAREPKTMRFGAVGFAYDPQN